MDAEIAEKEPLATVHEWLTPTDRLFLFGRRDCYVAVGSGNSEKEPVATVLTIATVVSTTTYLQTRELNHTLYNLTYAGVVVSFVLKPAAEAASSLFQTVGPKMTFQIVRPLN